MAPPSLLAVSQSRQGARVDMARVIAISVPRASIMADRLAELADLYRWPGTDLETSWLEVTPLLDRGMLHALIDDLLERSGGAPITIRLERERTPADTERITIHAGG